jgi:opacity protein-like surface antigen
MVFASAEAISQHLRLGAEAGLSFVDMPDYYTEDVSSGGLGFNVELHSGVLGKLELPGFPVAFTARVQYTWMTGSGNVVSDQLYASAGSYSTFQDILVVGAGVEWVVSHIAVSPHISTEILFAEVGQISFSSASSGSPSSFLKNPSTRVGFALGAGLEHSLSPSLNTDLHVRYNWNRLFGRAPDEGDLNTLDVSLALYFVFY